MSNTFLGEKESSDSGLDLEWDAGSGLLQAAAAI